MLCWAEGRAQVVFGMSHGDDTFQEAATNNFASPGEPLGDGAWNVGQLQVWCMCRQMIAPCNGTAAAQPARKIFRCRSCCAFEPQQDLHRRQDEVQSGDISERQCAADVVELLTSGVACLTV